MPEPAVLTREQLLPVAVALLRRDDAAKHHPLLMPPLPPCPDCGATPTEVTQSAGQQPLNQPATIAFLPCGHVFTASDDDIFNAGMAARDLLEDQANRPTGDRVPALCPRRVRGEPHDAHDWYSPREGRARCPGYSEPDEGIKEPAPPPTVAEQVRDLERIIERVREAVGTDQPVMPPEAGQREENWRRRAIALDRRIRDTRASLCEAFGIPNDEAIDVIGAARHLLEEARTWARHGYEIGQRHCGWTDHGVAPAWLTEGWPPHIDSCEHLVRASEYDTALARVRGLSERPEVMNAQDPDASGFLRGYGLAIRDAKRVARVNLPGERDREGQ